MVRGSHARVKICRDSSGNETEMWSEVCIDREVLGKHTTVATASKEQHDLNESSHVIDLGAPEATTGLSSFPLHSREEIVAHG
jgi:hypothetical protein